MTQAVEIMSKKDADKFVRKNGADLAGVVSINDTNSRPPYHVRQFRGPKLVLSFDDVEHPESAAKHGYFPPLKGEVAELVDFLRRIKRDGVMVCHCHAGVSRSSAAAMIWARVNGVDPISALDDARHWPNLLMLKYADEILDSEMAKTAEEWRREISGRNNVEMG
jgi:predicted protein tyrosine phosphatase